MEYLRPPASRGACRNGLPEHLAGYCNAAPGCHSVWYRPRPRRAPARMTRWAGCPGPVSGMHQTLAGARSQTLPNAASDTHAPRLPFRLAAPPGHCGRFRLVSAWAPGPVPAGGDGTSRAPAAARGHAERHAAWCVTAAGSRPVTAVTASPGALAVWATCLALPGLGAPQPPRHRAVLGAAGSSTLMGCTRPGGFMSTQMKGASSSPAVSLGGASGRRLWELDCICSTAGGHASLSTARPYFGTGTLAHLGDHLRLLAALQADRHTAQC
jgi:hypothetical protein